MLVLFGVVGVPLKTPAAVKVSPGGRVWPLASAHVYPVPEPPAAVSVCEYFNPA
jgi:hypothetical protein